MRVPYGPEIWALAERHIARVNTSLPLAEIKAELDSGAADLWLSARSAAVCQTRQWGEVVFAGGDLDDLKAMLARYENSGVDVVAIVGRPGWKRALAPLGYRAETVLIKEIAQCPSA